MARKVHEAVPELPLLAGEVPPALLAVLRGLAEIADPPNHKGGGRHVAAEVQRLAVEPGDQEE